MFQNLAIQLKSLYRQKMVQLLLKIAIFAFLGLFLYWQLAAGLRNIPKQELHVFWTQQFGWRNVALLSLVAVFMPLNWALETQKWVQLMRPVEKIAFGRAFKAILAGLTLSLFTPNRIGEYGGRVLLLSAEHRLHGVFATIMGSISQWLVLIGAGLLGLFYLLYSEQVPHFFQCYARAVLFLGILIFFLVAFCYFNISTFCTKALAWSWARKWAEKLQKHLLLRYSNSELRQALCFSALRYTIYSLQYFCLLRCFNFDCSWISGISAVSFVFLLQTGLPIPPSLGLLARSGLALWVFGWLLPLNDNIHFSLQTAVLASTFVLWAINVLLPAAFGALFVAGALGVKK